MVLSSCRPVSVDFPSEPRVLQEERRTNAKNGTPFEVAGGFFLGSCGSGDKRQLAKHLGPWLEAAMCPAGSARFCKPWTSEVKGRRLPWRGVFASKDFIFEAGELPMWVARLSFGDPHNSLIVLLVSRYHEKSCQNKKTHPYDPYVVCLYTDSSNYLFSQHVSTSEEKSCNSRAPCLDDMTI